MDSEYSTSTNLNDSSHLDVEQSNGVTEPIITSDSPSDSVTSSTSPEADSSTTNEETVEENEREEEEESEQSTQGGGLRVSQHVKNRDFWFAGAVAEEIAEPEEDDEPIKRLINGMLLRKGYLPEGEPLTPEEREKHRRFQYNPDKKKWVLRDQPLTDEELECWDYQARWLKCPITGAKWRDKGTILGVGLYHAPRFLSEAEKQRQSEAAQAAAQRNKAASAAAVPVDQENGGNGEVDGEPQESAEEQLFREMFIVYPHVQPPPEGAIAKLGPLPDDVHCGHIEVIVGPVFDIDAYNWGIEGNKSKGILPYTERGVVDMDQQYNALNFVYYVDKGNGNFERKVCTNRLSFYIDEEHGSRIFPENIESQISLLLYRSSRRFKDPQTGETNQVLLANAIRKVIPKILKAIVTETLSEKSELAESRLEHAIRTYLLIHQVAIKLILRYPRAYEHLYRTVVRWIQNPFTEESIKTWPNIEELLIAASLVGIPWNMLRESFMRKLIAQIMSSAGIMSKNTQVHDRIKHAFHQSKAMIHRILYEFSFFIAEPLYLLDRKYTRCAGTLPKPERDRMKESALAVKECNSLEKFWIAMGMDNPWEDEQEVRQHIINYFNYLMEVVPTWQQVRLPPGEFEKIKAPELNSKEISVATMGILKFRSEREKQLARHLEEERKKHKGLPKLNAKGRLDKLQCNFPLCGRKFKSRAHLMQHLRRVFKNLIHSYHVNHYKHKVTDPKQLTCGACGETFDSVEEIHKHYAMTNTPGYWKGPSHSNELWPASAAAVPEDEPVTQVNQWDDPATCVICLEQPREFVFVPCGHLCACEGCANVLHTCPICRAEIESMLQVFYAQKQQIKIYTP